MKIQFKPEKHFICSIRWVLMASLLLAPNSFAAGPFGPGMYLNWHPKVRVKVITGGENTCVLRADKTLKCWGLNGDGQLGQGDTLNRGDAAGEMGANLTPINLGTGRYAIGVGLGFYHTCAILDNGSVKCWGYIGDGRLGLVGVAETDDKGDGPNEMGDNLPTVDLGTGRTATDIRLGRAHTCALLDNGAVKCWGKNSDGQLGLGHMNSIGDNAGEMGDALPAVQLGAGRTAAQIATGGYHTCAVLDNGSLKCWGYGVAGRLGQGNENALGDGANEMGDNLPAINLGTGRTAKYVTAGNSHTCAILDNDTVKCWGEGFYGSLGQDAKTDLGDSASEMGDNLPIVNLGTGRTVKQINAGGDANCALLDNNTLKCWGRAESGQLGSGGTSNLGDGSGEMGDSLPAVALGTGFVPYYLSVGGTECWHTCVVSTTNAIKCFGDSTSGGLGSGDLNHRGDAANEMGDFLPLISL